MTEERATPKLGKPERALRLARARYQLRRSSKWPYILLGEQQYKFEGMDRKSLRADMRNTWRQEYPAEAPPADGALNSVIDDLKHLAMNADPDAPGDDADDGQSAGTGDSQIPADRGLSILQELDDCPLPDGYQIPEPYVVRPDGIWSIGWNSTRVTWAWLFPVRVYIDPDGDQWIELTWRDRRQWINKLVRRSISKSGRKLVVEAGDAGLPITDSEAKAAERWLAAAETANAASIIRHPVARQLGWQADGKTFVTSQDTPWRVQPRYSDQEGALAAHQASGTLASWQQVIKQIEPYPTVQIGLYAGLAAALLVPLGLDSFTLDFSGRSTRGKTITAQVGLSCWADPSERSDGLFSWKTSVIGVEKRLNLVNGLPVVIDETRLVKDPALVDAVIYQVPKNHGQSRGGGWPNRLPWRVIVISTGEQPATSFTSHQGASARTISMQRPPFGTDGDTSRAVAETVRNGCEANYGTAGPAFVAQLQAMLRQDGGRDRLLERHESLTALYRGDNDMTGRRAPLVACLALAAELAAGRGILPFPAPEPAAWTILCAASGDIHDNRPQMALDIVREYIASNAQKMWAGSKDAPASGWIGRDVDDGIALVPEKLREELRKRGYELDAVLPGWRETGALEERDGQEPPYKIPVRIAGRLVKCIVIKTTALEDPADQETCV